MASLYLRPNDAGYETSITSQYPNSTYHWDKVDDVTPDEDATYVCSNTTSSYQRDLYNLPAHTTETGIINFITILFRIIATADLTGYGKPSQRSGTTTTDGDEQSQGDTWATKSQTYTTNPATGNPYTWDEIDALQIGVCLRGNGEGVSLCTQVYVEVNYRKLYTYTGLIKLGLKAIGKHDRHLAADWGKLPDLKVEASWPTNPYDTPSYTDITDDVISISTHRGRQHELNRMESGLATILLKNDAANVNKLYENYNTGNDSSFITRNVSWAAQTFTPLSSHKIISVKLLLFITGSSPGTVTVSIRATGATGHPTGSDLCIGTTNGGTLPVSPPYEWREITLGAGYDLVAGRKYAIVVRALEGDNDNYLNWTLDSTSPTYTGGKCELSSNSGSSWTGYTAYDFMFEEWGLSVAPGKYWPDNPANISPAPDY